VAIVTGTSAGIGAGIARLLVQKGMIVVGVARRENKVQVEPHNLCTNLSFINLKPN